MRNYFPIWNTNIGTIYSSLLMKRFLFIDFLLLVHQYRHPKRNQMIEMLQNAQPPYARAWLACED